MRARYALMMVCAAAAVLALAAAALSIGAVHVPSSEAWRAIIGPDPDSFAQVIVATQRLPRVLMALHAGACLAVAGLVMQGLTRNPLASPTTLGVNAGATAAVLIAAFAGGAGLFGQGLAALAGGVLGLGASLVVARLSGLPGDRRGLSLIVAGTLVTMLCTGLSQALLLSDPARRTDFLSWAAGNINHAYLVRLWSFWWIGVASVAVLTSLARPLTLLSLGTEKAASAGVDVRRVEALALGAATLAASSAVAVCGPIGFIGLVVPHLVRPFAGAAYSRALPAAALTGAAMCMAADLAARTVLAPNVLGTGLMLDMIGGPAFVLIVRRHYLARTTARGGSKG